MKPPLLRPVPVLLSLALSAALSGCAARTAADSTKPAVRSTGDCVPAEALSDGEKLRLQRFAVLPAYEAWHQNGCFPPILDDDALARTPNPVGKIATIAGRDAIIVNPGLGWLDGCREGGSPSEDGSEIAGSDLLLVKERIVLDPELVSRDILEIGISWGTSRDGSPLFALYLGATDRTVFVACHRDVDRLVAHAAEAFRGDAG